MCLIVAGPAGKIRKALLETEGVLENVFRSNPDGIGVMFASQRRGLRIWKRLPKNADKARRFLSRIPGDERNMAVHFRWTTHGDTDLLNCHPYTIVEGEAALMHNGILRTGNSADTKKSDTWHFIKDYLADGAKLAPAILHDRGFKTMLKDYIGASNKFVIMTADGTMSIINASTGVEHDGLWFSNTYAWTPGLVIPGQRKYDNNYGGASGGSFRSRGGYGGGYGYHGGFTGSDYEGYHGGGGSYSPSSSPASSPSPASSDPPRLVVHNGGVTRDTRFTAADEEEEAAWRKIVERTARSKGWRQGGTTTATPSPAAGGNGEAGAGDDSAPEKAEQTGTQAAGSAGAQAAAPAAPRTTEESARIPTTDALTIALLDADVDKLNMWLESFPTTLLHMLFLRYKPTPTKFTKESDLEGYLRFLYAAVMNEDRRTLIAESEQKDGSTVAIAEVLSFYVDWKLKPSPFAPTEAEEAMGKTPEWETQDTHAPTGERRNLVINGLTVANTEIPPRNNRHGSYPFPVSAHVEREKITVDGVEFVGPPREDTREEMPHEVADAISESRMSQGGPVDDNDGFAARTLLL